MGISVGVVGTGVFAENFIPLFLAHPQVDSVTLCDNDPVKLQAAAEKFGITSTCPSYEELCQSDVDTVAIFTQKFHHAQQAIQALRSGKHVYCSVPVGISPDEVRELVKTVEETGLTYVIGETSYYYPGTIFCRRRHEAGDFGEIVLTEAEYLHDTSTLYSVYQHRYHDDWRLYAGMPPLHYPTHSMSAPVSVTGAHAELATALGWVDRHEDGLYGEDANVSANPYSNEVALFQMSDGSLARLNEFRRVAARGERMRVYGTHGSFEQMSGRPAMWIDLKDQITDLTEEIAAGAIPSAVERFEKAIASAAVNAKPIHPYDLLPQEYIDGMKPTDMSHRGHMGSHKYLINEFVLACVNRTLPPNNVWQGARYILPGFAAHDSAVAHGVPVTVPDLGDAPDHAG